MNWPIGWTSLDKLNDSEFEYWKAASSEKYSGSKLREMWFNREAGAPPCRQESNEQLAGERHDFMLPMPPQVSLENTSGNLSGVRDSIPTEADTESEAMREFRMSQDSRPAISRIAVGINARVDRLKAIGNGQVPAVARLAWNILSE
jgi:hypothetical protein